MNKLTPKQVSKLSSVDLRMYLIELIHPSQQDDWYEAFIAANNGDYCNNWNDLMDLCDEHLVECRWCHLAKEWNAVCREFAYCSNVFNSDSKRVRAECLYLVLQEKAKL